MGIKQPWQIFFIACFVIAAAPAPPNLRRPSPGPALSCPATIPSKSDISPSARLIGSTRQRGAGLVHATITSGRPAQAQPDGTIAELENNDDLRVDRKTNVGKLSTYFNTLNEPNSLVCEYGDYSARVGFGRAMLLIPLPSNIEGECVLTRKMTRPQAWKDYPTMMECRKCSRKGCA